jgi:hypothetical protein
MSVRSIAICSAGSFIDPALSRTDLPRVGLLGVHSRVSTPLRRLESSEVGHCLCMQNATELKEPLTMTTPDERPAARKSSEQKADPGRRRRMNDTGDGGENPTTERRVVEWARNARATVERHPGILLAGGAGAVVLFGVLLYARRSRRRREQGRDALIGLALRLLGPGYASEPAAPRPSVIKDSLKQASTALAASAGRELGRRALLAMTANNSEREERE